MSVGKLKLMNTAMDEQTANIEALRLLDPLIVRLVEIRERRIADIKRAREIAQILSKVKVA